MIFSIVKHLLNFHLIDYNCLTSILHEKNVDLRLTLVQQNDTTYHFNLKSIKTFKRLKL